MSYQIGDYVTIKNLPKDTKAETGHNTGVVGMVAGNVIRVDLLSPAGVIPVEVGEGDVRPARQLVLTKENICLTPDNDALTFELVLNQQSDEWVVSASYELWFDVDAYFGTETKDNDSTWINFYTQYDGQGNLHAFYFIESDERSDYYDWELLPEEKELLMGLLNERIQREGYADISDYLKQELKELNESSASKLRELNDKYGEPEAVHENYDELER